MSSISCWNSDGYIYFLKLITKSFDDYGVGSFAAQWFWVWFWSLNAWVQIMTQPLTYCESSPNFLAFPHLSFLTYKTKWILMVTTPWCYFEDWNRLKDACHIVNSYKCGLFLLCLLISCMILGGRHWNKYCKNNNISKNSVSDHHFSASIHRYLELKTNVLD